MVDLKKGKKVREITGGPETEGLEFSADGKKLIVTNEADNTITEGTNAAEIRSTCF